jgi:hypothetical protein
MPAIRAEGWECGPTSDQPLILDLGTVENKLSVTVISIPARKTYTWFALIIMPARAYLIGIFVHERKSCGRRVSKICA